MTDKPPSTNGSGKTGVLKRVIRAIKGEPLSRDDIQDLLQHDQDIFEPEEKEMLSGVLDVAETQVREVMVPRSQMVVIERQQSLQEMLNVIISSGHSRFPVTGEDRDEVLGILLAKDLLKHFVSNAGPTINIDDYLRRVSVIPESKRLNTLLREFRESRTHMAVVVDEYGGVSGLLTIEDVLEEIVGEIDDEHDQEAAEVIRRDADIDGKASYSVQALTRIEDFNDFFECELAAEEDYDTIGGLVMHELGRLPRAGESLQYGEFVFRVTRADRRRIDTVQVIRSVGDSELSAEG